MRGRDHPDVESQRSNCADRPALSGLEEPEHHGASLGDELTHLVEEHRAAIDHREQTDLPGDRAGESATLVTEELTSEQLRGEVGAVDPLEGPSASGAEPLDRGGDQLLPGPRFALYQNGYTERRNLRDPAEERQHGRAPADDPVKGSLASRHARPLHRRRYRRRQTQKRPAARGGAPPGWALGAMA
jgi:hypothetical protein